MPDQMHGTEMRIETDRLRRLISAYETAAINMAQIAVALARRGRLAQPWTQDDVSVGISDYYNDQVSDVNYSCYAALVQFETEARNVVAMLKQTLASYQDTDSAAAASFQTP